MPIHRFEAGPRAPTIGWRVGVAAVLGRIFPQANPDLEPLYEQVTYWWLAVDHHGFVSREIGFDHNARAIVAAPLGDNLGIFADLDGAPQSLGLQIPAEDFEAAWQDIVARYNPRLPKAGLL